VAAGLVLSCFSILIFETTVFQIFLRSKQYLKDKNRSMGSSKVPY